MNTTLIRPKPPTRAADQIRRDQLKVHEIFRSIQGESSSVGWPTVFVRLTGCPLRCTYCDTEYAFHGGGWMSFDDILDRLATEATHHVTVTGGEPLAQKRCYRFLVRLCDAGYNVSLETSGAMDLIDLDPRVRKVVDIKTPGSGEQSRNLWSNLECLTEADELKFVICDRADYEWCREQILDRRLTDLCTVLLSPSWGQQDPTELAQWMLKDRLPVRFQTQLHKHLWGEEPGR